ncbi:hypothetical protein [Nocardia salmonicida]|uniref:hypothetical protein n=1 Tax=Nocardia salmonicida TaxID=53431 RepID=UPI002E2B3EF4|nr:hypothetical protein [Nocardia salmonicida]
MTPPNRGSDQQIGLGQISAALRDHSCGGRSSARSLAELHDEVGGSAIGFSIISAYCRLQQGHVSIPPWHLFTRREIAEGKFDSWLDTAVAHGCTGLMAKVSGTMESFSPSSARGANSSKSNHALSLTIGEVSRLSNSVRALGDDVRGVLGQHLVPAHTAVYFHAYVYGLSTVAIELLGVQQAKMLIVFPAEGLSATYCETIGEDARLSEPNRCAHLATVCRDLAAFAAESTGITHGNWNIEGLWASSTQHVVAFQMRPSPQDRPFDRFATDAQQLGSADRAAVGGWREVWRTRFVWGAFSIELDSFVPDAAANFCLIPERGHVMDELVESNGGKADVLYISNSQGFRLTHESELLPSIRWRRGFRFCYVPDEVLAAMQGRRTRFESDGDRCVVSICSLDAAR